MRYEQIARKISLRLLDQKQVSGHAPLAEIGRKWMLRLGALLVISMVLCVQPASATYYTYNEWSALPEAARTLYISGALDGLTGFGRPEDNFAAAQHYSACISNAKMTNGQLATNILNYAKDKPALHTQPAVGAMIGYLIAACGRPPQPKAE
jgi:hypothetical protein